MGSEKMGSESFFTGEYSLKPTVVGVKNDSDPIFFGVKNDSDPIFLLTPFF